MRQTAADSTSHPVVGQREGGGAVVSAVMLEAVCVPRGGEPPRALSRLGLKLEDAKDKLHGSEYRLPVGE